MVETARRTNLTTASLDFWLVGGLSYLVLAVAIVWPFPIRPTLTTAWVVSLVVNYPHFMHSYQLLYEDFADKCKNPKRPAAWRYRYIVASIAVPGLMAVYFTLMLASGSLDMLAYAANAMLFTVGWHYSKQSYGMLIALSALKRVFYTKNEKVVLLVNSYAVWALFWVLINRKLNIVNEVKIPVRSVPVPAAVVAGLQFCCVLTAAAVAFVLVRKIAQTRIVAFNALAGYATTWGWLLLRPVNLLLYAIIPAFHSLQYLPFVYRLKWNQIKDKNPGGATKAVVGFATKGVVLGVLWFIAWPAVAEAVSGYDRQAIYGRFVFGTIAALFINIHHYFIDNVLWRRDNPDASKYLFGG